MIENQSVSSTLYVPLKGNIFASKNFKELLYDKKALELENIIPKNDIEQGIEDISGEYYYLASASRYYNMDMEVNKFIKTHKKCNIVNMGAGFCTMYYRIENKENATFYELDLKNVMDERRKILPEQKEDIYIDESLLEVEKWTKQIKNKNLPTLLIFSGIFYYFKEEEVNKFFKDLKDKFEFCEVVFDCDSKWALKISNRYVEKTGNKSAKMYFYIDNISKYLEKLDLNIELIEEYMMFKYARKILKGKISFKTNLLMWGGDFLKSCKMIHLKIN